MKLLAPDDFIPSAWQPTDPNGPIRMFNPGLALAAGTRVLAYRLVLADGRRRLAICRLDASDRPLPGTVVPLSDLMPDAGPWQADPRLCVVGDRLFLHFNNGDRLRPNSIYLVELDPDSLMPLSPPRPLCLAGPRRAVEKNWMVFTPDGEDLLAIYSIRPHVVLRLHLAPGGPIICRPIARSDWSVPALPAGTGEPRGGTTPVRVGDHFFSFFHMLRPSPVLPRLLHRLRHRGGRPLHRYDMGFYGFDAAPPYRPVCFTPRPVLPVPARQSGMPPLNRDAERVLYPMGSLLDGHTWTVSAGMHDERSCLLTLNHIQLLDLAEPVG